MRKGSLKVLHKLGLIYIKKLKQLYKFLFCISSYLHFHWMKKIISLILGYTIVREPSNLCYLQKQNQ